jgi:acyl carrier protein
LWINIIGQGVGMDILNKLQGIFRDVLDDEGIVLTADTSPENLEDWDSLAQINIIAACESEFDIKFDLNEVVNIKNVCDMLKTVEGKL